MRRRETSAVLAVTGSEKAHGDISLRAQAGSQRLPASYGTPGSQGFNTIITKPRLAIVVEQDHTMQRSIRLANSFKSLPMAERRLSICSLNA